MSTPNSHFSVLMSKAVKSSATIEDYLVMMYIMQRDGMPIIGARLAAALSVTPPTISNTLKRMERDGLVDLEPLDGPRLTDKGLTVAQSVMRRHMLTEWMLVEMLNVSWADTHAEAHQLEHAISQGVEKQMQSRLENPKLCPHGNPFPGFESITADWIPLNEIRPGEKVIIRRIHETAEDIPELLAYLEENGVMPGADAVLAASMEFNQTLIIDLEHRQIPIGFAAAQHIFVERQ